MVTPRSTLRRSQKAGLPPGVLVHIGERKADKTQIQVMTFDQTHLDEQEIETLQTCIPLAPQPSITWINVDGLHEVEILGQLGECLKVHPLIVEDILNTNQRPKLEEHEDYIFIVLKSLYKNDEESDELTAEQISLVLGPNYVVSFQEQRGDEFDTIRKRIRADGWRARKRGADYLAYALIDMVVDYYFTILERFGEQIESLEEELISDPTTETLQDIYELKREMVVMRKMVWPLREVIARLERSDSPLVQDSTKIYLRDVHDHTIQVIDAVETYRDTLSGMLDIYLSSVSNRMNEIMKVLTIIATIFIPLTFIAGVYGMNFHYMPELGTRWGYPAVWLVMIVVAGVMLIFFHRRKWL